MARDLAEQVRNLSPGALQIFKRQIASLPDTERERVYSQLSGVPELSDIIGRATPVPAQPARQPVQQPQQTVQNIQADVPLWQKALSTIGKPFEWIEEKITKPFGSIVTSPFTPSIEGTEDMSWLERERAEYNAWDDPTLKIPFTPDWKVGIKGIVETLPWLALPSAGSIAGKLGMASGKFLVPQGAGAISRAAGAVSKIEPLRKTASVAEAIAKPFATAERIAALPITLPLAKIGAAKLPSKVWKALSVEERTNLARELGVASEVGEKTWGSIVAGDKKVLSKGIKEAIEEATKTVENWKLTEKEWASYEYPPLVNEQTKAISADITKELSKHNIKVESIKVKGSRAIGVETPKSDMDIYVKVSDEAYQTTDRILLEHRKDVGRFTKQLSDKYGIPIDILVEGKTINVETPQLRIIRGLSGRKKVIEKAYSEGKLIPPGKIAEEGAKSLPEIKARLSYSKTVPPEIQSRVERLLASLPSDVSPEIKRIIITDKMITRGTFADPTKGYAGKWTESEKILRLNDNFADGDFYHEIAHAINPNMAEKGVELAGRTLEKRIKEIITSPVTTTGGKASYYGAARDEWLLTERGQKFDKMQRDPSVFRTKAEQVEFDLLNKEFTEVGMSTAETLALRADQKIYKEIDKLTSKIDDVNELIESAEEAGRSTKALLARKVALVDKLEKKNAQLEATKTVEGMGGTVPPTIPKAPPTLPEPTDADRFWETISSRKGIKASERTAQLQSEARAERASKIEAELAKYAPGDITYEVQEKIWRELGSGPLPRTHTRMGLPKSFLDEGVRTIREVLADAGEFEIRATTTAFKNALEEGGRSVPRIPGSKGGSAYTRLKKVFGKETADILSDPQKLQQMVEVLNYGEFKPFDTEIMDYLRKLANDPHGQAGMFGSFINKEGLQLPMLDPFDASALKLSPGAIMDKFGYGPVPDPRSPLQKQVDYMLLRSRIVRAEGKNLPPPAWVDAPMYPSENVVKQLAFWPEAQRVKLSKVLGSMGMNLLDAANIGRATLASFDFSGVLRQAGVAVTRHPIEALKALAPMFKATFSPEYARNIAHLIDTDPIMQKFMRPSLNNKIYVAPNPEIMTHTMAGLTAKEESFMSNIAMRIPVIGEIVKASARAFVTFTNLMRRSMAHSAENGWLKKFEEVGFRATDIDYSEMARLINGATGRGDLKFLGVDLNKQGGILNTILFSPRWIMSRFQWPTMVFSPSREVRVEAWKQIGTFVGTMGTVMSTAKLSGAAELEFDPRSADFGKLKVGETRLDIWTGYAQYMRLLAQLTMGQRKTEGGLLVPYNRKEVLDRFTQSKFSPAMGLLNDIMRGQTFMGEEFPSKTTTGLARQMYDRMAPLAVQDMIDGFAQSGATGALITSPAIFGVGAVTYMDEAKKAKDQAAQREYDMSWEELGKQMGQGIQSRLEQTDPAIMEAEKKAEDKFAASTPSITKQWHSEGEAIEKTYRKGITQATNEFRITRDGATFAERVRQAQSTRREMYSSRSGRKEYQGIADYYNQPLSNEQKDKMNPNDVLRIEYYQRMYGAEMTDQNTGVYNFAEAERRELEFVKMYGQDALNYIEDFQGSQWMDRPPELIQLEVAKELLRPYWKIADSVWAMYPPELKNINEQLLILARTDEAMAKRALKAYPQILRARKMILEWKQQVRKTNPMIAQAYNMFYGGG